MEQSNRKNPWLGLESYKEGEVLYGRDDDIRDLIQCILNDTDTLLYGKSGIGKSSLLNAGILPAARRNGYLPIVLRLSHKGTDDYLSQIKESVRSAMDLSAADEAEISSRIKPVIGIKNKGKESIYEYFHRHEFYDKEGTRLKLLFLFDQFEEIFTLQHDETKKKLLFAGMADYLNDIMPDELQPKNSTETEPKTVLAIDKDNADDIFDGIDFENSNDIPKYVNDNDIHFVFTIREDFLSEFEYYSASIPSLKHNRYGLRPINEEQASQIILRPMPGLISKEVAQLIIEKVTGRKDFKLDGIPEIEVDSAVLSLYLNRLYEAKTGTSITAELVEQKGGEIIIDFYNDAISDISETSVEYLEDKLINGQGCRDNVTLYAAMHTGGLTQNELDILCDKKKILRLFNYAGMLRIEYIHDILCPIITARKDKREEENRIRRIKKAASEERHKSRKRLIGVISAFVLTTIAVAAYFLYNWYFYEYPLKTYYLSYELRNGWPVGVGKELSESERATTPLYYELSHLGHKDTHFTTVRICSSNQVIDQQNIKIPLLLTDIIPADSVSGSLSELKSEIRRIEFSPTAEKYGNAAKLDYIAFFDDDSNLLFSMKQRSDEEKTGQWFSFYDSKGSAMTVNDNNVDRINIQTDSLGYVSSAFFYDKSGVKRSIQGNVYGYNQEIVYDASNLDNVKGFTVSTINQFSFPVSLKAKANAIRVTYNADNVVLEYLDRNKDANKTIATECEKGCAKIVYAKDLYTYYGANSASPIAYMKLKCDSHGNVTQYLLDDKKSRLSNVPAKTTMTYDSVGRILSKEMFDKNNRPYSPGHAVYKYVYNYSTDGEKVFHEEITDTGMIYYYEFKRLSKDVTRTSFADLRSKDSLRQIPFHIRVDSIVRNTTITRYFNRELSPINYVAKKSDEIYKKGMLFNKVIKTVNDSIEEYTFFKIEGDTIIPTYGDNAYYRLKRTLDKDGNVLSYQTFDKDNKIIKSMMYYYKNGISIGCSAMGIDNNPVRCGEWDSDNMLYYKMYFNNNFNGMYCDFMVLNEFDELSSISLNGNYFTFKYVNLKNYRIQNPPNDVLGSIDLLYDYWQSYPRNESDSTKGAVVYFHSLTHESMLYQYGLRDGDIISSCGNWRMGNPLTDLMPEIQKSCIITILRPNIDGNRYDKKSYHYNVDNSEINKIHLHEVRLKNTEVIIRKFAGWPLANCK